MVAMRRDVGGHPAASQVLKSVHRSFAKPNKWRFNQALLESVSEIEVLTPAGLYLGQATTCRVSLDRLCRVIKRTTLGLYFAEFGVRLPDNHGCKVYALDGFDRTDPGLTARLKRVIGYASQGKLRVFGDEVFMCFAREVRDATVWIHLVYGRVGFLAITRPLDA